jgi:hypothetical protein
LFQFPWRFLGPLTVLSALLLALLFDLLEGRWKPRWKLAGEAGVLALLAVSAIPVVAQIRALPEDLDLYQQLQPQTVRLLPHRSTVGDEYLPATASREIWRAGARPIWVKPESTKVTILEDRGSHLILDLDGGGGGLVLGRWYFPGWSCSIDGSPCSLVPSQEGLLTVGALPYGRHTLELRYRGPVSRRLGYLVTLVSLLATLFWVRQLPPRGSARA